MALQQGGADWIAEHRAKGNLGPKTRWIVSVKQPYGTAVTVSTFGILPEVASTTP